jgi:hypothetical protein
MSHLTYFCCQELALSPVTTKRIRKTIRKLERNNSQTDDQKETMEILLKVEEKQILQIMEGLSMMKIDKILSSLIVDPENNGDFTQREMEDFRKLTLRDLWPLRRFEYTTRYWGFSVLHVKRDFSIFDDNFEKSGLIEDEKMRINVIDCGQLVNPALTKKKIEVEKLKVLVNCTTMEENGNDK